MARTWVVHSAATNRQGSYALNGHFYSDTPHGIPTNLCNNASDISHPDKTPFFSDAIWFDAWPLPTDRPAMNEFEGDSPLQGGLRRIAYPHHAITATAAIRNLDLKTTLQGAVNVTFADNHVETVKLENLWGLCWHKNWEPPPKGPVHPDRSAALLLLRHLRAFHGGYAAIQKTVTPRNARKTDAPLRSTAHFRILRKWIFDNSPRL